MKLNELFDGESFGVPTPSPREVAKKHRKSTKDIMHQVKKGEEEEKEHTQDTEMAQEIALDHLKDNPEYYDDDIEEDAAGVGTITAQNSTVDVKPGQTEREMKKFNLESKDAPNTRS